MWDSNNAFYVSIHDGTADSVTNQAEQTQGSILNHLYTSVFRAQFYCWQVAVALGHHEKCHYLKHFIMLM